MNLNISVKPGIFAALEAEASARDISCEEAASKVIETFFDLHGVLESAYDVWVKEKVEEGLDALRRGDVRTNEEVERDMEKLQARVLAMQASDK